MRKNRKLIKEKNSEKSRNSIFPTKLYKSNPRINHSQTLIKSFPINTQNIILKIHSIEKQQSHKK
jgi:hypothetical protein